jgi:hypothetical protein
MTFLPDKRQKNALAAMLRSKCSLDFICREIRITRQEFLAWRADMMRAPAADLQKLEPVPVAKQGVDLFA